MNFRKWLAEFFGKDTPDRPRSSYWYISARTGRLVFDVKRAIREGHFDKQLEAAAKLAKELEKQKIRKMQ